jgi:hypothetical protein
VTGICCALAIEYFQQFPQDATRIRLSVIVVVATTIFGLLLAMDVSSRDLSGEQLDHHQTHYFKIPLPTGLVNLC